MCHTFRTGLFIASHDQTDSFVQFHTGILQKFHRIKCFNYRPLVICSSTSVHMVAISCQLKWIVGPVTAYRYNIKMACNTHDFLAFSHFGVTAVVIKIYGFKAKLSGNFKSDSKRFCRSLSERFPL